jgi:hypothetical protein
LETSTQRLQSQQYIGLKDFVWFETILNKKVENSLKSGKINGTKSTRGIGMHRPKNGF